jgi:hypothetical protein
MANVKHKEEMQRALEAQKLGLEEMWQKQLENKQKQWEEMQAREMEQVCRSLQFEWEGRMHREIAADRVRHEMELGRHFKLALEAQTLRLEEDYAQQLEEMREKEDRKWMQKLLMEREALLAMAKTVLAQERETWRVSQEAEWRIMLAKERVQWEESEQQTWIRIRKMWMHVLRRKQQGWWSCTLPTWKVKKCNYIKQKKKLHTSAQS